MSFVSCNDTVTRQEASTLFLYTNSVHAIMNKISLAITLINEMKIPTQKLK